MTSTRHALFAGISVAALMLASPAARAADLPTKAPIFAPRLAIQDRWVWWGEGGAIKAGDPAFGPFPFLTTPVGIQPGIGWEAAVGFDFVPANFSPYHISGQFRYGESQRKNKVFPANVAIPSPPGFHFGTRTTSAFASGTGTAEIKDQHWLIDFAVGRDYQLGSGQVQAKIGIRIADIKVKITGSGTVSGSDTPPPGFGSPITGIFAFIQRSRFLGVGPRVGVDGSVPLNGGWTFDYVGGVAVLFGDRKLDSTSTMTLVLNPGGGQQVGTVNTAFSDSSFGAVFNLDAQAGFSYWFTRNFKMTASFRFDGYWNALRTVNTDGAIVNENRFYYGPMLRATLVFP
jgi:hypothetical protein